MIRTNKFRLYPDRDEIVKLNSVVEACRVVYNHFVEAINSGSELDRNDMNYMLTELKEENPWLTRYHSKMLQMVSTQAAAASNNIKSKKTRGYKVGKLHVIKKGNFKTFTYNQSGFKIERHGNTDLLWLSKIGWIEIRLTRAIFNIKQITITKKS